MPLFLWLGSLLGSLFASLVAFFLQFMTKKLAIIAAVVAALSTITFAFFAAIAGLVATLAPSVPWFISAAISMIVPDNFILVISIVMTARLLRWVYEWNVRVIQMRLS